MAVEIGTLVLKGSFGQPAKPTGRPDADAKRLAEQIRREVLHDVRDIVEEALRRERQE